MEREVRAVKGAAGMAVRTAPTHEVRLAPEVEADGHFDALAPFVRSVAGSIVRVARRSRR